MRVALTYVCHTVPCAIAVHMCLTMLEQEPLKTVKARNDVLTCYCCVQSGQSNVCHTAELFFASLGDLCEASAAGDQLAPAQAP